jgi:hypothetical protein
LVFGEIPIRNVVTCGAVFPFMVATLISRECNKQARK